MLRFFLFVTYTRTTIPTSCHIYFLSGKDSMMLFQTYYFTEGPLGCLARTIHLQRKLLLRYLRYYELYLALVHDIL